MTATFTESLHAPFLSLTSTGPHCLAADAPLAAYERLDDDRHEATMQRVLSTQYRINLVRQLLPRRHAIGDPRATAPADRSRRWQDLCDRLDRLDGTVRPDEQSLRLLQLCLVLGFHNYVAKTAATLAGGDTADELVARALYLKGFALRMLTAAGRDSAEESRESWAHVVRKAPPSSRVRFYAASALLVDHAKGAVGAAGIDELRDIMREYLDSARDAGSPRHVLDHSRYFRAVSYRPFLAGDEEATADELGRAEALGLEALRLAGANTAQRLVALDNMHAVLETRMREALRFGDTGTALARMRRILEFDPLDSKAHLETGQVHVERGEWREAGQCFRLAARYGPPGTQVAKYLAGQCAEREGDDERALDLYLDATALDGRSPSTLSAVAGVAGRLGRTEAVRWARRRLAELEAA